MLCWVQIKLKLLFFPPFLYFYFSLKKIFFCFSVSESPESHSTYINLTNTKVLRKKLLSCIVLLVIKLQTDFICHMRPSVMSQQSNH